MAAFFRWIGLELSPANPWEKLISGLGGLVGIGAIYWISLQLVGQAGAALMVASMGASAVLLFAVPHGALSQPWPVLGGHVISAIIGVSVQKGVADPLLAAPLAVGLAIGVMHFLRCIHPPGGASALAAVIGGPAVHALGYGYVVTPVLLNALIIFLVAIAFNAPFSWRRYPVAWGRPLKPMAQPHVVEKEDLKWALGEVGSFVDLPEEELEEILELALARARKRKAGGK